MRPAFLDASLRQDRATLESLLDASVPDAWLDDLRFATLRLAQLRADPTLEPWLLRAIVVRNERVMAGHVGCHGPPDADGVELGYTVFARHRRRGYAREAMLGLMGWAHDAHDVTRFVVSISPTNAASTALAAGLGFVRIGAHVDEADGPEDVFELRI